MSVDTLGANVHLLTVTNQPSQLAWDDGYWDNHSIQLLKTISEQGYNEVVGGFEPELPRTPFTIHIFGERYSVPARPIACVQQPCIEDDVDSEELWENFKRKIEAGEMWQSVEQDETCDWYHFYQCAKNFNTSNPTLDTANYIIVGLVRESHADFHLVGYTCNSWEDREWKIPSADALPSMTLDLYRSIHRHTGFQKFVYLSYLSKSFIQLNEDIWKKIRDLLTVDLALPLCMRHLIENQIHYSQQRKEVFEYMCQTTQ